MFWILKLIFYWRLNRISAKILLNQKGELCIVGGTYELFAGRDASRGLATMAMKVSDTFDDLQDLSETERQKLAYWEKQFTGRHGAKLNVSVAQDSRSHVLDKNKCRWQIILLLA